jgi:hypothetical protein
MSMMVTAAIAASMALSPANGGTAAHPQGHKVSVKITITTLGDELHPVVTGLELWYGRGIEFHRDRVPVCTIKTLNQMGPDGCPAKSHVGLSPGGAIASDDLGPNPTFNFINGPGGTLVPYTVLQRPARVRAPLTAKVVHNPRSRFPNRDLWDVPDVLQVVAGIPITLSDITMQFGGQSWAKDYIATTGCPKGGWEFRVRVRTDTAGVLETTGRAPCRQGGH